MGIGVLRVAHIFRDVIASALPAEHRIVAVRDKPNGDVDMLIRGPALPDGDELQPPVVDLHIDQAIHGEVSTFWAFWEHQPHVRWQVRNPWVKVAQGCD